VDSSWNGSVLNTVPLRRAGGFEDEGAGSSFLKAPEDEKTPVRRRGVTGDKPFFQMPAHGTDTARVLSG